MNRPTLILLVGIPGSGKTTYADRYIKEHPSTVHLSSDLIRNELWGSEAAQGDNNEVFSLMQSRTVEALNNGQSVVYDATNVTRKDRSYIIALCPKFAKIECHITWVPIETCIEREKNANRLASHGLSQTKLYTIWLELKQRCCNPANQKYEDYGGRGICVCNEWKEDFESFYNWSIHNGYREDVNGHSCTIDRINNNGNYCPENCRWTNSIVQGRNQRIRSDNTSGVKGVNWDDTHKKWVARISVNKARKSLGYFNNKQDAINARIDAEKKYWGDSNDL